VVANGLLARPEGFDVLLQLFDSTLTYRSMYPGRLEVPALLDLLVIDETNPRALYGVHARLRRKLAQIEESAGGTARRPFRESMPEVAALPTLEQLCTTDSGGGYPVLVEVCERLCAIALAASNEISARYFSHAASAAALQEGA
jgi:uncharacterized alpha-E superfamily protein